jgi:hypothetical protein
MSIITKSGVTKGTPSQFTLNKLNLSEHAIVQDDSYFSNLSNWYRVNIIYKSAVGSQYEIVEFDATQESPTGTFLISEKARDEFQVLKIKILDFDGGFLEIPRSSLDSASFDINLSSNILTGAYTGTPMVIQSKTSANQPVDIGEGQEFIVNSSVLVSSVKVLLAKGGSYSQTQNVGGTLKMVLKASNFIGSGAEVESTTTFDLSNLKSVSEVNSNIEDGVVEFTFATPVLLPSGVNSIKFKLMDYTGSGSTAYLNLFGYTNQIPGDMYSYNTALGHVDYWFQIIGNVV